MIYLNKKIDPTNISSNYQSSFFDNYNLLVAAIASKDLTDCLLILERVGIPDTWGVDLLPLIELELELGGMN